MLKPLMNVAERLNEIHVHTARLWWARGCGATGYVLFPIIRGTNDYLIRENL